MQIYVTSVPTGRNLEVAAVNTNRIRFRQQRRLRVTRFELISVVRIYGSAMSLNLPVSRNGDVVPIGSADRRICDVGRKYFIRIYEIEFPCAVQQRIERTFFISGRESCSTVSIAHKRGSGSLFVNGNDLDVLPVRLLRLVRRIVCQCCAQKEATQYSCEHRLFDHVFHMHF